MRTLICLAVVLALSIAGNAEAAQQVSAAELLQQPEKYDGREVIYKGEVIGDIFIQQGFAWVNVHDGTRAIGVFCPQPLIEQIEHKGNYNFQGDQISLRGVFHNSCAEHGGDLDIHAAKITLIKKGATIAHPLEKDKIKTSIILSAATLFLAIVHLVVKRFR
ncbi:hypothetical protein ACFL1I_04465 [Candidatus Omnitrophota bacterium]